MAKDQQRPRRINAAEVGIDLVLNVVEHHLGQMHDQAGWDVTGSSTLVSGVKEVVARYLAAHPSILPFLETGFTTTILAFLPNLSPEARQGLRSAVDIATDGIKQAMKAPSDAKAEADLAEASSTLKSSFKKLLEEEEKRRKAKKPYHVICAELPQGQRDEWFYFDRAVQRHGDQDAVELLEKLKPLMPGKELIVEALGYPVGDRLDFLKSRLVVGKPGLLDTLKDAAMGRETPWTRDANRRVREAEKKARKFGEQQDAQADKIKKANVVSKAEVIMKVLIVAVLIVAAIVVAKFA